MNDETRDAVRQWKAKAESDWTTVEVLRDSERCPADVVCFHCQQYVEKLLKGLLSLNGVEAPKTHDLRRLIQLAGPFAPELSGFSDASDALTGHGVQSRYPGDRREIDQSEMNRMIDLAKDLGAIVLGKLNL